jgi:hypothetical protein
LVQVAALHSVARGADKPGTVSLSGTGSPEALAKGIASLISASTRSELDRLVSVPDCTTALAAGWELVRRTMPETEQKDVVTPDLLAISRFLGLVEQRLRVPVPKTWAEALKSVAGYGQKDIWFQLVQAGRKGDWRIKRDGAHLRVKRGIRSIKLPAGIVLEPASYATAECVGEWAYVAVYSALPDSRYTLFAIDQGNGKVRWSTTVWGTSRIRPRGVITVGYSGSDWHVVETRSSAETLAVFGFSGSAVYVEVFDRKTGENRCRFSTAYFHELPMTRANWP